MPGAGRVGTAQNGAGLKGIAVWSNHCALHVETIAKALSLKTEPPIDYLVMPFANPGHADKVRECKSHGIKTCAYWLGSDLYRVLRDPYHRSEIPAYDTHVACHQRLADELVSIGINAHVVPFLARHVSSIYYEPMQPNVGVYMPNAKRKYGFKEVCEIAEAIPDLQFVFYGNNDLPAVPVNVYNVGRLMPHDASVMLDTFSVVLRYTIHDGLPQNVIEAKMRGKQCVTSYPYLGCLHAPTPGDVIDILRNPDTHTQDMTDAPQWYLDNCTPEAFDNKFRAVLL